MREIGHYIGGQHIQGTSGTYGDVFNPASGEVSAKVAMANAELYGKRIEVSRQVIGLYGNLKKLDAQIEVAKVALVGAKQSAKGGANDQSTKELLQKAEAQLVQTISQREQAEKELRLIIGKAAPSSSAADERLGLAQSAESPKPGHALFQRRGGIVPADSPRHGARDWSVPDPLV